ncbi:hypothetical protein [Streptomyces sp. CS113]|uniref:hypothetical protein n=1 Tax=Streptomyces sp. CS113 TaxID=1982761 RepID=UPI0015C61D89
MAVDDDAPQAIPNTPKTREKASPAAVRSPLWPRHVEETVEIAVPLRTAYNQWTQFKAFPRFSYLVHDVERIRPTVTVRSIGHGPLSQRHDEDGAACATVGHRPVGAACPDHPQPLRRARQDHQREPGAPQRDRA